MIGPLPCETEELCRVGRHRPYQHVQIDRLAPAAAKRPIAMWAAIAGIGTVEKSHKLRVADLKVVLGADFFAVQRYPV